MRFAFWQDVPLLQAPAPTHGLYWSTPLATMMQPLVTSVNRTALSKKPNRDRCMMKISMSVGRRLGRTERGT